MFDILGDKIKSGIYQIYNKITNKRYIGSSINIKRRLALHKWFLRNNRHHNAHLLSSWNKYGEIAFIFEPLEYCTPEVLLKTEHEYIIYYKACNSKFGYNVVEDVETVHKRLTEEAVEKISKSSTGRKWTEEQRMKFIKSRTGKKNKKFSEKLKLQIANGDRIIPRLYDFSKEKQKLWKDNISKGRKKYFENIGTVVGKPIKVTIGEKTIYFPSVRKASESLGISEDCIRNTAVGKTKIRKLKCEIYFVSKQEYNLNLNICLT